MLPVIVTANPTGVTLGLPSRGQAGPAKNSHFFPILPPPNPILNLVVLPSYSIIHYLRTIPLIVLLSHSIIEVN